MAFHLSITKEAAFVNRNPNSIAAITEPYARHCNEAVSFGIAPLRAREARGLSQAQMMQKAILQDLVEK